MPSPFSALLSYLSQYGTPVGLLIPLGRSLQRHTTSFTNPRQLVAFSAFDPLALMPAQVERVFVSIIKKMRLPDTGVAEFDLRGRLFLAYAPSTNQLEIMSLLPGRDSFDFQIIEHYGTEKATIKSPSVSSCNGCHQHGGPIFSPDPWDETNASPAIALLLKRHHPSGHINLIPIDGERSKIRNRNDAGNEISFAQAFENLTNYAADMLSDQKLWQACKDAKCRAQVLKKTFASVNLLLPSSTSSETPVIKNPPEIIEDRFIVLDGDFNILEEISDQSIVIGSDTHLGLHHDEIEIKKAAMLGYSPSPAAQQIIAKLKKQHNVIDATKQTDEQLIRGGIVDFFVAAVAIANGEELPRYFSVLTAKELDVVYTEVEKILTHVHRQDLHLRSHLDPLQPRNAFIGSDIFKTIIGRNSDNIFRQHLLLPTNKKITEDNTLDNLEVYLRNKQPDVRASLALSWHPDFITTPWIADVVGSCKKNICKFQNFSVYGSLFDGENFVRKEIDVHNFAFSDNSVQTAKQATSSKISFTSIGKTHHHELLCGKALLKINGQQGYRCIAYNSHQLSAAIDKLAAEPQGLLHADYINSVAIIKALLTHLGYDLKTYSGNIGLYSPVEGMHIQSSQLHSSVHKILLKDRLGTTLIEHCGGCHDTHAIPAPFLAASSVEHLCRNIKSMAQQIIYRIDPNTGVGDMPPLQSEQNKNFTAQKRQALVNELKKGMPSFCQ